MKKVIFFIILLLSFVLLLTSCAEVVSKSSETVKATVVDKQFDSGYVYTTYMYSGKVMIPIVHTVPDSYEVTIEYNGIKKTLDSYDLYNSVNIGDFVECVYTVTEWDDGQIDKELIVK